MKNMLLLTASALLITTACRNNDRTSPSSELSATTKQDSLNKRNKEIAVACIHAFERGGGDVDFIISHNDKATVDYGDSMPVRGIDAITTELRQMRSMVKETKTSNELAVAENNYVFVYQVGDETDSTGKTYHSKGVHIFKFNEEGKIVAHTFVGEQLSPNQEDYFAKEQIR